MIQPMFPLTTTKRIQIYSFCCAVLFVLELGVVGVFPALAETGKQTLADQFFNKGLGYYWAQDIPQHYNEAFVWLSKAAEYGHPRAQSIVADMYNNGLGTKINFRESIKLTKAAAEQQDVYGQFLLGKALYKGLGIEKDSEKGTQILSQILNALEAHAESGDAHAQSSLAWIYYNLSNATKDYQKAHLWYEKAAIQGYAVAQSNIGLMFGRGDGVRKNSKAKIVWYRRAAGQGSPIGQFNLALALGEQGDFDGKFTWARRAANLHYADAEFLMGQIYEEGEGGPRDLQEALSWYQRAAAQDHAVAQYKIGELYHYGTGMQQDYTQARKWYEAAAENGHAAAMANLGHFFEKGFGVKQSYEDAWEWYVQGADQNNSYSQARLGYLYMHGYVVNQDYEKANEWLLKAARGGDQWAYYGIGLIHEEKRQYSQAIRWYLLSAINGYGFGFKRAVYLMVLYPVISLST